MNKNKEVRFSHGDLVHQEYPEHLDRFITGFLEKINNLIASYDIELNLKSISRSTGEIDLGIQLVDDRFGMRISFIKNKTADLLLRNIIDTFNQTFLKNLNNQIIIAYRPTNNSILNLKLSNSDDLRKIDKFQNLVSNPSQFNLQASEKPTESKKTHKTKTKSKNDSFIRLGVLIGTIISTNFIGIGIIKFFINPFIHSSNNYIKYIILVLLYFIVYKAFKKIILRTNKSFPHRIMLMFGILISSYLSIQGAKNSVTSRLYIDNATNEIQNISYSDKKGETKLINIHPNNYEYLELPIGKTNFLVNGKRKTFNLKPYVDQIFNIDTANTYILTEEFYSSNNQEINQTKPKMEFIKQEFFQNEAEYLFEAPEAILKKGGKNKITVLYRYNNLPN